MAIARDGYGVPSVTGTTEDDLWWGAGYAVAQDRLAELELFRRRGNGTLAEILGKSMLADDIVARRDYYTTPELQAMLARLPPTSGPASAPTPRASTPGSTTCARRRPTCRSSSAR